MKLRIIKRKFLLILFLIFSTITVYEFLHVIAYINYSTEHPGIVVDKPDYIDTGNYSTTNFNTLVIKYFKSDSLPKIISYKSKRFLHNYNIGQKIRVLELPNGKIIIKSFMDTWIVFLLLLISTCILLLLYISAKHKSKSNYKSFWNIKKSSLYSFKIKNNNNVIYLSDLTNRHNKIAK